MASHKWWERPARQTKGMSAISIREGGGYLSVYARVSEKRRDITSEVSVSVLGENEL